MKRIFKLAFTAKSIDGGTGTYLKSMQIFKKKYTTQTVIFEPPQYRDSPSDYIFTHRKSQKSSDSYLNIVTSFEVFLRDILFFHTYVRTFQPDIVLSVDIYANLIALIVRFVSQHKYKIIATTHNYLSMTIQRKSHSIIAFIVRTLVKLLYVRAERNIAVSEGVRQNLINTFKIPEVDVIQNGVLFKEPIGHTFGGVVISVGRLVEQKDHNTLIRSFLYAHKKNKGLQLWIVGDGPLKGEIVRQIDNLGLKDSIKMLGWRADINLLLGKADIFAHASHWEGFPYVILEAMAHGLPVVATDSMYGINEILEGGKAGILVKNGDATAMGGAILNLANDSDVREHFSQQSKRTIAKLSVRKMIQKYSQVLNDLTMGE
jgi:glycosyltransferase involved in cell wall biosynthesis